MTIDVKCETCGTKGVIGALEDEGDTKWLCAECGATNVEEAEAEE